MTANAMGIVAIDATQTTAAGFETIRITFA
ncbi:MAG: hypothetical protein JWN79_303 [Gemmatimonadetes bacterium]|nr:hypothetical protein [Gemmatimonadota bacterium]